MFGTDLIIFENSKYSVLGRNPVYKKLEPADHFIDYAD